MQYYISQMNMNITKKYIRDNNIFSKYQSDLWKINYVERLQIMLLINGTALKKKEKT